MFIEKNKEEYGISVLCDKYEVSTSGYYAWRKRLPSKRAAENELLAKEIRRVHHENREVYGGPRVYKALRAEGYMVNHKRVERIMREEGIRGRICSVYHRSSGRKGEGGIRPRTSGSHPKNEEVYQVAGPDTRSSRPSSPT